MDEAMGTWGVLQKARVQCTMSSFNGVVSVYCFKEDTEEIIFLRAKEALKRVLKEPPGEYQIGVVISRIDVDTK